jgi:hypothetical protein
MAWGRRSQAVDAPRRGRASWCLMLNLASTHSAGPAHARVTRTVSVGT